MNIGKKLLSLLTVFCLTLSLVPTMALAATPSKIVIGTGENSGITLDQNTPYLISKSSSATNTLPNGNTGYMYFDTSTGVLELHKYNDQGISWTHGIYASSGDLTIKLFETNYIKSANNGIYVSGNLTIEGTGSLELTKATNTTIYASGDITIQGGAKVKAAGGQDGQAIHAVGGTLTITGSGTKVEATHGFEGAIKTGNNNGTINLNDSAQLIAPSIDDIKGNLKINGADATPEQKGQISNTNGITAAPSAPTYTVSGMVKDSGGQAIVGATVQLCTADTVGTSAPTVINTSDQGGYSFSGIPAGIYTITVSKTGYEAVTKNNITVNNSNVSVEAITLSLTNLPVTQTYTVTIMGTEHMSLSSDSGALTQTVNQGSTIENVVLKAAEGYYFPTDYGSTYESSNLYGLIVTRNSYTQITVSGTPAANADITLPLLKEKTTQDDLTYNNFNASDCTNSDNNDGKVSFVSVKANANIEYQKETYDSDNWISFMTNSWGGGIIENLTPGTYLIRYPATETKNASTPWKITILPYTKYDLWVCGIPVTDENKGNILGDNGTSTVAYNSETKTLTLNNAQINNTAAPTVSLGSTRANMEKAGIMSKSDLTIQVTGNSTINSTNGNAINAYADLRICGNSSLELNSHEGMSTITLNYDKIWYNLAIADSVKVTTTLTSSAITGATPLSANNVTIQDSASLTAVHNGTNLAIFCEGALTVKDSATLIAQSENNNHAVTVENGFTYPGHIIKASEKFDGSNPDITYNPAKLDPGVNKRGYRYVEVRPTSGTVITGIKLNKELSIKVGTTETLTPVFTPTDATEKTVTWTSSDKTVATVDQNGKVTAVGVGTATITVLTKDGGYTDTCTVTVSNPSSSSGSHTTYYPVNTPAKSEGGSVVVSPKSASKGAAVTVTVTPESGYQVSSVQAVDEDGKKLTLTDKGDGKYSFVMPGSKVEVSASFAQVQKPEETSPYRDVSKDSYYYDAVQWASDKGITNGVADGVFAPDWVCTRGQIVTFLWRSVGSPAPKTTEMPFADVAEDAYYAQAVLWAVENGITKGTSETTFSPDQTCTRAHAVAFLYRLAGSPAVTGSSFQDVTADAYYNAAVAWAVQQGITNGTSETTFSPDETCTRAQIVTFLYRMDQAK